MPEGEMLELAVALLKRVLPDIGAANDARAYEIIRTLSIELHPNRFQREDERDLAEGVFKSLRVLIENSKHTSFSTILNEEQFPSSAYREEEGDQAQWEECSPSSADTGYDWCQVQREEYSQMHQCKQDPDIKMSNRGRNENSKKLKTFIQVSAFSLIGCAIIGNIGLINLVLPGCGDGTIPQSVFFATLAATLVSGIVGNWLLSVE